MTGSSTPQVPQSQGPRHARWRTRRGDALAYAFAVSLLVLSGLSCASAAPGPAQPLEQDVTVAVGKTARISGTDLVVSFDRVLNDSRCPSDAQCISAGDAIVAVTATGGRAPSRRYELHTDDGTREVMHGEFRLSLINLKPLPTAARPVPSGAYVLTLRVGRP